MDPNTGHIVEAESKEQMEYLIDEGYVQVPKKLTREARLELMGKKSTKIGLNSTGSLARHAKKIRKQRAEVAKEIKDFQKQEK